MAPGLGQEKLAKNPVIAGSKSMQKSSAA